MLGNRFGTIESNVSSPPFVDPTSVAGCCLWLDGNDPAGTGIQPINGASISAWVDKSGEANDCTATVAPLYVNPYPVATSTAAIAFDGTRRLETTAGSGGPSAFPSGTGGRTEFYVFSYNTSIDICALITYGLQPSKTKWLVYTNNNDLKQNINAGFIEQSDQTLTNTTNYIGCISLPSASPMSSATLKINNAIPTHVTNGIPNTAGPTGTQLYVGSDLASEGYGFKFEGMMMELIIYNNEISGSDYTKVYNYLSSKWGI